MSESRIATVPYGEFSERIHRRAAEEHGGRAPLNGSVELTYRCNLRCVHCYIPHRSARGELGTGEWKRILDEVAEAGCLYLLVTGGEPFLRRDALALYRHARRLGLLVTLFSNATRITPAIAEELGESPPFSVEVTLYGASPETYQRVTGTGRGYHEALRGVRLLQRAGIRLTLKTVVLTENREDLPRIRALAEEMGLPFRFDATVHPRTDGNRLPLSVRLPAREVAGLDAADPRRMEGMGELLRHFPGPPRADSIFPCGAGRNAFHVDPFGRYLLCESVPLFGADARSMSFREFWEGYVPRILERPPARSSRCQSCTLHSLCAQCPAWSLLETGTLEDPVDYLCEITAARAAALGLAERPPGWSARGATAGAPPAADRPPGDEAERLPGGCHEESR